MGTDAGLGALSGVGVIVGAKCNAALGGALVLASSVGLFANKIHTVVDAARNGEKTQKAE